MYFSSFSVTLGASSLLPEILSARALSFINTKTRGERIIVSAFRNPAVFTENASQCSFARHFGITSPKVSTKSVVTPVATAEPMSPKICMHSTVAIDEQPRFTTLLQIKIAVRALSKWSITYSALRAFLLPLSTFC